MNPDLDGYPILRIDQLHIIPTATLQTSLPDAKALIENLREEANGDKSGGKSQKAMMKYLQKQVDQTLKEIATREAEDRVNALLNGTKPLFVRAISVSPDNERVRERVDEQEERGKGERKEEKNIARSLSTQGDNNPGSENTPAIQPSSSEPKEHNPPPVAFYEPIPLPSQLAAANKPKPSRARAKEMEEERMMQEQEQQDNVHISRSAGSSRRLTTSSENELLTSRSSGTVRSPVRQNDPDDTYTPTAPGSNTKPRRRPRSGNSAADSKPKSIYSQANLTGTSKLQNQMQIQQNFGNAFMVGATEKKKRFYPKKVVQETEAERREKLREKGRNQAMMRLLERKNKQIERNEEMKLRRMEEKAAAAKKKKEDVEKRHKRMEQQRVLQQQRKLEAREKEMQKNTCDKSSEADDSIENPSNDVVKAVEDIDQDVGNDIMSEVDVDPSSEDESLSGGDDDPMNLVVPQTELECVEQNSAAVFDSYRLRNMAMKIDSSDSETEVDVVNNDIVTSSFDKQRNVDHEENVNADRPHDEAQVESATINDKSKAALNTLRKLKLKKKQNASHDNENGVDTHLEIGDNNGGLLISATEPPGEVSFDNFQCEEGVRDILFVDENNPMTGEVLPPVGSKKAKKRRKKSRGGGLGELSGVDEDSDPEGMGDDVEGKKKKKKKRKKRVKRMVLNDDGEEVEVMEIVEVDDDKKKKKKKKVKKFIVNDEGEEVEVIEEVEVKKKRKKKRETSSDEAVKGDKYMDDLKNEEKLGVQEDKSDGIIEQKNRDAAFPQDIIEKESFTKGESSSSAPDADKKKTTYDASYAKLNNLFCSFFLPNSIFSTLVEEISPDNPVKRTVHMCSKGPDNLPGLSAWTLSSIGEDGKPQWFVEQNQLLGQSEQQSPRHSSLLQQRSTTRKEVSYGIVLLARVCESLLIGKDFLQAKGDLEPRFKSDWQNRVAQFDTIVAELTHAQQDTLFKLIYVCGNTASVVSKLENLVTTAFMHPPGGGYAGVQKEHEASSDLHHQDVGSDDVNNKSKEVCDDGDNESIQSERVSKSDEFPSDSETDSLDNSSYDDDSDDDYMDHFAGAIEMLNTGEVKNEGVQYLRTASVDEEALLKTLLEESSEAPEARATPDRKLGSDIVNGDSYSDGGDSDMSQNGPGSDDESMVLPDSSIVFAADSIARVDHKDSKNDNKCSDSDSNDCRDGVQITISTKRTPSSSNSVVNDIPTAVTASNKIPQYIPPESNMKVSKSSSRKSSVVNRKKAERDRSLPELPSVDMGKEKNDLDLASDSCSNETTSVKITDVYKSIAEIFPAVRAKMDSMQAGCRPGDHAILAKILLESMHVQLKVYEDWLEVMDDYATVFSSDNGKGIQSKIQQDDKNSAVYSGGSAALHYRVKSSRPEVNNIIKDVFGNVVKGWEELPTGLGLGISWNLLWSWSKPKINMTQLLIWQRVNHFQNSKELTRKDTLKKNLHKYTSAIGNKAACHFEIMPQTFLLPAEYTLFVKEYSALEQAKAAAKTSGGKLPPVRNMWIVKPVGLSRGRGISMLEDLSSLTYSQSTVLQKYIDNPLCLDGYKFDLRIYVVVTSFSPLEAFIYRDGFARISTVKYSTDEKSLSNLYIHLTNSSIQKHSESGPSKDNPLHISQGNDEESNGSKIGLLGKSGLWKRLEKYGIDIEPLWQSMCLLIVKSLVVVNDKIANQPCNFELFGYDVLFDQDLKPWLIEVNSGPSLARENQLDIRVKNELITDIVKLLDPPPFDRAALTKVLKRRINDLQQKKFSMTSGDPDLERDLHSILGSHIPRRYGEEPKNCGNFQRLCPGTQHFSTAMKLKSKLVKSTPGMKK